MSDQTTDHLARAAKAGERRLALRYPFILGKIPISLLTVAEQVVDAAAPHLATYYEDKVRAAFDDIQAAAEDKGRSEERERLRSDEMISEAMVERVKVAWFDAASRSGDEDYVARALCRAVLFFLASLDSDQEER